MKIKNISKFLLGFLLFNNLNNNMLYINAQTQEIKTTISSFEINEQKENNINKILFVTSKRPESGDYDLNTFKQIQSIVQNMNNWKNENIQVGLTIIDKYNNAYGLQSNWDANTTKLNKLLDNGINNGFANLLDKDFYFNGTSVEQTTQDYLKDSIKDTVVIISGMYKDYKFMEYSLKNAYKTIIIADEEDKNKINSLNINKDKYEILESLNNLELSNLFLNNENNKLININIKPSNNEEINSAIIQNPNGDIENLEVINNEINKEYYANNNGNYSIIVNYYNENNSSKPNIKVEKSVSGNITSNNNSNNQDSNKVNNQTVKLLLIGTDEYGNELYRENYNDQGLIINQSIDIYPKNIEGYTLEQERIQFTPRKNSDLLYIKYNTSKGTVVIQYKDSEDKIIKEETILKDANFGTDYKYTAPESFESYIINDEYKSQLQIEGKVNDIYKLITFKYHKNSNEIKNNENNIENKNLDKNNKSNNNILFIILSISAIFLFSIIGFIIYYFIKNKKINN